MEYIITGDDDGHHYVIPADKSVEFEAWLDRIYQDSDDCDMPVWCIEINGSPTKVKFKEWRIA